MHSNVASELMIESDNTLTQSFALTLIVLLFFAEFRSIQLVINTLGGKKEHI